MFPTVAKSPISAALRTVFFSKTTYPVLTSTPFGLTNYPSLIVLRILMLSPSNSVSSIGMTVSKKVGTGPPVVTYMI